MITSEWLLFLIDVSARLLLLSAIGWLVGLFLKFRRASTQHAVLALLLLSVFCFPLVCLLPSQSGIR